MFEVSVDAEIENIIDLFVENPLRQAKGGYLAQHEPAAFVLFIEQVQLIPERCQVSRNRQACRPGPDQSNLTPVRFERGLRHEMFNVVLVIGSDPFETADGNRLFIHTSAATGRLAGTIARSTQ